MKAAPRAQRRAAGWHEPAADRQHGPARTDLDALRASLLGRELPALVQALEFPAAGAGSGRGRWRGIAHPRRLGIAAHFGVVTGLPARRGRQYCAGAEAPGPQPGDRTPLIHRGEQIGWALRSKLRCNPLIVSPGFGMTMDGALTWTRSLLRGYRLPEPTPGRPPRRGIQLLIGRILFAGHPAQ